MLPWEEKKTNNKKEKKRRGWGGGGGGSALCQLGVQYVTQAESNGKVADDNERENEQCLLLLHQTVCLGRTWDPSPCVCVRPHVLSHTA